MFPRVFCQPRVDNVTLLYLLLPRYLRSCPIRSFRRPSRISCVPPSLNSHVNLYGYFQVEMLLVQGLRYRHEWQSFCRWPQGVFQMGIYRLC